MIKQLPKMVNKRLSDLSYNIKDFDKVKSAYKTALKDKGYFSSTISTLLE